MPAKIVIKPYGGLANRMRALDSANNLAGEFKLKLNVIWELSPELNCSFFRLFEPSGSLKIQEYSLLPVVRKCRNILTKGLQKAGLVLPLGYEKYLLDEEILDLGKQNADFREVVSTYDKVYIRTTHQFYKKPDSFKLFKPIRELQTKISEVTQRFDKGTVGLHIRRTDNAASIKYSPVEGFIDAMNIEIAGRTDASFFLATDSTETENQLKTIFGDRIITRPKNLERNSEEGIQDALIDLYCLSNTSKIIGSYYSSFSEVASQINHIPLTQVYKS